MQFAHPYILWLLLLIVPIVAWYIWKQRSLHATLALSTTMPFAHLPRTWKQYMRHVVFALRVATLGCLIVIMARPQLRDNWRTTSTEGTDIVIALDVSSSMMARDFKPDRFEAAKEVAAKFIAGRENDNIGIVIFAGESLTGMPMTVDRAQLLQYLQGLNMNVLEDGTAIGDGIATALNRLKEGKAKSKSIILLTDGSNNTGVVAPLTATDVAKELGVKIYTIGVGTNGMAPYPTQTLTGRIEFTPQQVVIDEATLRTIADKTGGQYFRATGNRVLADVFEKIDALEKTRMDVRHFSHTEDDYMVWAWIAFACFAASLVLRYTILRTIP